MDGVADIQIVILSRERKGEFAGKHIDPFLAFMAVVIVSGAIQRHRDADGAEVKEMARLRERHIGEPISLAGHDLRPSHDQTGLELRLRFKHRRERDAENFGERQDRCDGSLAISGFKPRKKRLR